MKQRVRAMLATCIIVLALSIAGSVRASAIPEGVYIIGCVDHRCRLYDMTGKVVKEYGMCGENWAFKVIIREVAPVVPPPILNPPLDPVWQGHDAWWWVNFVKSPLADGNGEQINIESLGDPALMPYLECNVVHVN